MITSFYSIEELQQLGIKRFGCNVLISHYARLYNPEKLIIGDNVRIDDFCILSGKIVIGSYVHISAFCCLHGFNGIEIGDFCGTSARTTIYSAADDFSGEYLINPMIPSKFTNVTGGLVKLDNFVQIGANSIIMPNIRIKEGAVTGAFSFVNQDLESWSIYAGIPAKKISKRKKALLNYVLDIKKRGQF